MAIRKGSNCFKYWTNKPDSFMQAKIHNVTLIKLYHYKTVKISHNGCLKRSYRHFVYLYYHIPIVLSKDIIFLQYEFKIDYCENVLAKNYMRAFGTKRI